LTGIQFRRPQQAWDHASSMLTESALARMLAPRHVWIQTNLEWNLRDDPHVR